MLGPLLNKNEGMNDDSKNSWLKSDIDIFLVGSLTQAEAEKKVLGKLPLSNSRSDSLHLFLLEPRFRYGDSNHGNQKRGQLGHAVSPENNTSHH